MRFSRDGSRIPRGSFILTPGRNCTLGSAVIALVTGFSASGQPQPTPGPGSATQPGGVESLPSGTVEFDEEPFHLDSVGLTMLLPVGSKAEGNTAGGRSTVRIQAADDTWLANIQTPRTSNPDLTSAGVLDDILTQVLRKAGEIYEQGNKGGPVAYKGQVILPRETRVIEGLAAERAFVRVPGEGNSPPFIHGYYVFRLTPVQYVTFELITTEPVLTSARREFEAMVTTAKFADPAKAGAERGQAIATGLKVFERVNESMMRAIVEAQPERWERLFRPGPTGARSDDEEVGYRRIRTAMGRRGDLDPTRTSVGAGDRQPGVVVRMDARFIDSAKGGGRIVDSQAVYFMSPDRATEGWNVRNAIRLGKEAEVFTEVGAREGTAMSVSISPAGGAGRTVRPLIQGEGYISRVESLLLAQILIRSGLTADAGFYAYQSETETIRLRRDNLEQPPDRPGMWRLTTTFAGTTQTQVGIFNEKGEMIRTHLPNGVVQEPIAFNDLVSLWQGKGLPMN